MHSFLYRVPSLHSRTVWTVLLYEQMLYFWLQTRNNERKAVIKCFINLNFSLEFGNKDYISEQWMHFQKCRRLDKILGNRYEPEQPIKLRTIARTDVLSWYIRRGSSTLILLQNQHKSLPDHPPSHSKTKDLHILLRYHRRLRAARLTNPKTSTPDLQQYEAPNYPEHGAHDPFPRISTHGPKSQQFRHHAVKLHNWASSHRLFDVPRHELFLWRCSAE